ncbi:hypothetical protein EYF80_059398 [Liparis tanakae]|uniref:Uncharacterized protein n=1 Tax=Liparis tanakae TaxID=230148 RepID=A0A4Z2EPC7_9TELE|nr:hypothetical protein EYF80_059398 [Liparis tanakae]
MAANTPNQPELNLSRKQNRSLERSRASSSAPWNKPNLSDFQVKDLREPSHSFPLQGAPAAEKPNLKLLHSLKECLQLLRELAVEGKRGGKTAAPVGGSSEPGSLETSRSLILQWAEELERNMVLKHDLIITHICYLCCVIRVIVPLGVLCVSSRLIGFNMLLLL